MTVIYNFKKEVTEHLNCRIGESISSCVARKHLAKTKFSMSFHVCLEIFKGIDHFKGSEQFCNKLMKTSFNAGFLLISISQPEVISILEHSLLTRQNFEKLLLS